MNVFSRCVASLVSGAALAAAAPAAELTINGAGATFPSPVYRVWTYGYGQQTGGKVQVNYQGLGSGAGINQIKAGTVDFGGTDNPLTVEELDAAGLAQFPMLTGGVVVIVNIPGVKGSALSLDRQTLADIFLGRITRWNDPAIRKTNPDLRLPDLKITVVHRADGSGTTFIFTNFLSKISADWKRDVGCGAAVKWPVGLGGQKNPGVCNNVRKISGSIGYTEYTYAVEAKIATVSLKNRSGRFVAPTPDAFRASAANADWQNAPGFYMVLTDQPGDQSWPITGVTYLLVRRDQADAAKARALFGYFDWCFTTGSAAASKLKYVPLPESVVKLIHADWARNIRIAGQPFSR